MLLALSLSLSADLEKHIVHTSGTTNMARKHIFYQYASMLKKVLFFCI